MNKYEKKYPSRHKPGIFVTVAQWLGELMCERKALSETKELPRAFWLKIHEDKQLNQQWSKYLKTQTQHAYKLLKEFDEKQIVEAIKANSRLYSLLPKWVKEYIANFKVKVLPKEPPVDTPKIKENPKFRTSLGKKKSILDKLEDL